MSGPVTVVARRRVRPGSQAAYEDWLERLTGAAADLPGYIGAELHRPKADEREYTSIFRFDSLENLEAFERSDMRARFLAEIAPHVDGDAVWDRMTGLEVWFDPPPGTVVAQPSPHRMALLLIAVVFTLVLVLNLALAPLIGGWPLPLRLLLVVVLQVTLLTYVIMPRLTRALARFIYPATKTVS
ncbi:antibiotic biosynthesis monooxygenase [Roseitalea porphyridii]|uniref:Antibiotic biosynthesis monooxygenase n=1 Tax=Roseitalea porphyridii TaxID=1852022 RepID=A0A4P6V0D4_9HYPH|nr:antibiotic biosynthesis monooxygenase [Roseitalea porphyridii]QBK30283.1 antibiotic biosynthesis monooxygenase [Roseitalea porphyridii]